MFITVAATWVTLSLRTPVPGSTIAEVVPTTKSALAEPTDLNARFTAQLASEPACPAGSQALVDDSG